MDLSQIRTRLGRSNTHHYSSPEEFVADVYLMFRNCAKFNYVSTAALSYGGRFGSANVRPPIVRDDPPAVSVLLCLLVSSAEVLFSELNFCSKEGSRNVLMCPCHAHNTKVNNSSSAALGCMRRI